jgi:hypothetical protein
MKKLFISECTEFELGWGSRPHGFMISETKEAMHAHISESNKMGSYDYFWRYNEPSEIACDDEGYEKIKNRMNEKGLAFFNDREKEDLNLYAKI